MSLIVEEVQKLTPKPRVLFFYCKQNGPEHNTFLAIARSFILQLLNQDRGLLSYLYRKHCDSDEAVLSSMPLVQEMLNFLLSSCQSAYIIIDGLDECESQERKVITQWFRHLVESLPANAPDRLRCLFVSRDDGIGVKDLQGLAKIIIELRDNKQDILAYSKAQAEELRRKFEVSEGESSRMAVAVAESANGMNPIKCYVMFTHSQARHVLTSKIDMGKLIGTNNSCWNRRRIGSVPFRPSSSVS